MEEGSKEGSRRRTSSCIDDAQEFVNLFVQLRITLTPVISTRLLDSKSKQESFSIIAIQRNGRVIQ